MKPGRGRRAKPQLDGSEKYIDSGCIRDYLHVVDLAGTRARPCAAGSGVDYLLGCEGAA